MNRIYLDHNASTPLDPAVLKAVIEQLNVEIGNPSSIHKEGRACKQKLNESRDIFANYLKVKPGEVTFNSGGSEGAATLIRGFARKFPKSHIITSVAEHPCVYKSLQDLKNEGFDVTFLPTGLWGAVQPNAVEAAIKPSTQLIMLMAANNETGVKTDIESISRIAQRHDLSFYVDGVALLGKELFSIPEGVSAMFFSGHKVHAPKGVGALYIRSPLKLPPLIVGGAQEFNRRAGTENLAGIVGFGLAVELLQKHQQAYTAHMLAMRDRMEQGILNNLKDVVVNGQGPRIVNTSNLSFLGVEGESLLIHLDKEIAVSHGSACSSGAIEPSRILLQMGIPLAEARSAIRFSLSRFTTVEEVDRAVNVVVDTVRKLRRPR